jgi:anti-anti-sigma factor
VRGEVDIAIVGELRHGLTKAVAARPARLVVDLAATAFIDCSGMAAIAQARQDGRGADHRARRTNHCRPDGHDPRPQHR